ncbi:MAG TPA: hypothetical protein VIJ25_05530, partial [Methylococcales bacterium]
MFPVNGWLILISGHSETTSDRRPRIQSRKPYCFNGMVGPFLNGIKSAKVGVLSSTKRRGGQYEHYYNRIDLAKNVFQV